MPNSQYASLHQAAFEGDIEAVKKFIDSKAIDVNRKGVHFENNTPLYIVAARDHEEIVQLLFAHQADVAIKNDEGNTALHIAAALGHKEIVELLLQNGASIDAKNNAGDTALHLAIKRGHTAVLRVLLQQGADMTALNKADNTPLHSAANRVEILGKGVIAGLLEFGADIMAIHKEGNTPLHLAAQRGYANSIRMLLEARSSDAVVMLSTLIEVTH